MSSSLWLDSYKPTLSSGVYGEYIYTKPIQFHPKSIGYYLDEKNNQYYVANKFEKTLQHIHFDIDEWYPHVESLTFETKFIPIHPKHAQAIVLFYRYRYCNASISTVNMDIVNNLKELQQTLDQHIKQCINEWYDDNDKDKGVFIRFSNRSPKDGHKVTSSSQNDYQNEENKEEDPNAAFINFCRSTAKDLFVDNADDAMALILSSERVFTDLLSALNAHKYPFKYLFHNQLTAYAHADDDEKENKINDDPLKWNEEQWDICKVSIAIRKWDNRIRDDLEFRCFVFDKKLRAISQYNHYCYFKELGDNALFVECIKKKIMRYFEEEIVSNVPYRNYVIDIGIIVVDEENKEQMDALQTVVIELNPFETTTGAGLFDWGRDEKQLKNGKEVEIRVHHKSVVTKDFVDAYLSESDKYTVEMPWFEKLNEMEREIIKTEKVMQQDVKKKDCIIL